MLASENRINVLPVLNQIECHPRYTQSSLVQLCQENHIAVEAYMPFSQGAILKDSSIRSYAECLNKPTVSYSFNSISLFPLPFTLLVSFLYISQHGPVTPAQLILRWLIQKNIIPIPKSASSARMRENLNIFDFTLTPTEMEWMNNYEKRNGSIHCDWDTSGMP